MSDFFRVLYVDPASLVAPAKIGADMALLRSWLWEQTAHVRWRSAGRDDLADVLGTAPQVALLDWPENDLDSRKARKCIERIRAGYPEVMIFVVPRNSISSPFPPDLLQDARIVELDQESFSSRAAVNATWRNKVKLALLPVNVAILPSQHLAVKLFLTAVKEKPLKLVIQKFFPKASKAQVYSVAGGWSGTKICRIFVDNQEELFYIKLFDEPDTYQTELRSHFGAQQWLGSAVVELVPVEDLGPDIENQFEAFPRPPYAICYRSASTIKCERYTLEEIYRRESGPELVRQSLERLLQALASQETVEELSEMPWGPSRAGDFSFGDKFRSKVLAGLERLQLYGDALPGGWRAVNDAIEQLVYCMPQWLNGRPCSFKFGCVHGDPNCRNCLVASNNPVDLRLIDCGGFQPSGRLMSDLAIIERDVKLLLMGTELEAAPCFDLDIRQLPEWCRVEAESIESGLGDMTPTPADPSISPAYRLVELVRQRAKALCSLDDPDGRQYFAMLLFWTLEALQHDAVRPTKKLLALFSASQILRKKFR